MKKTISILFLVSMTFITQIQVQQVFAQTETTNEAVSAPQVVAPAQPVNTNTTANTATTTAPTGTAPQQPSMMGMALPFVIMLALMYFMMIRPQQKRVKEHANLLSGLKNGDEIVTSSGIIGTVTGMSEKVVTVEVSKNVQMKILKSQVNQVVKGPLQDIQA